MKVPWHKRWDEDQIGFHQSEVNPTLVKYFSEIFTAKNSTVLVPLCGKSLDLLYLREQKMKVVGVEIVEKAVIDFFSENKLDFKKESIEDFQVYTTEDIEIFCGDIFKLSNGIIGTIDYVYDRAALIAFPASMRRPYAEKITELSKSDARNLAISAEFDGVKMPGPPFPLDADELNKLFASDWEIKEMERHEVIEKVERFKARGIESFVESVYLLTKN